MASAVDKSDAAPNPPREVVDRAFGAENRARLLERYFADESPISPANAWKHVYRLLLWIDRTTALAHCYESDKAQPERPWYARSLAFHDWLSQELQTAPRYLRNKSTGFSGGRQRSSNSVFKGRSAAYEQQRSAYANRSFPEPGEDPELAAIIREALGDWISSEPPAQVMADLTRRIHTHLSQENKRKNLVVKGSRM